MALSQHYNMSFSGVQAWEQTDGAFTSAGPDKVEDSTKLHIPGGNTTVVQTFGLLASTFDLPIAVETAQLTALQAKRGTTGTLICSHGTFTGAFLDGVLRPTQDTTTPGDWKAVLRVTV